ncbi:class I SAM-dependent methyltransferase [Kitasatospora sp. NPDC057015]|uniref:class I SAM-dependent methyltransferase n=1 Tax=Kitasatospora sp. NPDC057015 TaxID=3346001 RepID=UPI0036301D42
MHQVVNTEQAQAWNGYEGQHWADHHDRWQAVNEGFDEHLFTAAAIGPDDRVLDIGCGTGRTTRSAARRAPGVRALGLDLSAPMLARARAATADDDPADVAFVQGDAQVFAFPPASFDVVVSRFATMFFSDPVAAFTNVRTALRPGGRLALVCMGDPDRNDWLRALFALRPHLPLPPLPSLGDPGMFSLADPARIREVLSGAGYSQIDSTAVEAPMHWGRDAADAARFLLGSGPAHHLLARVDAATARRAEEALTAALRPHAGPDGVRLRGSARLVTAVAP